MIGAPSEGLARNHCGPSTAAQAAFLDATRRATGPKLLLCAKADRKRHATTDAALIIDGGG
ncbi:hypothetical protein GCM10011491_30960 [Brucella endophytica]|uniref:Uncharacterized protein n=1 Tax=Brucella endophytica TaxID=1963359 RepID=A0A916SHA0_9HYPH|nr:hypothetical protein GCM10011491_30960 [Brucella endophytica]